MTTPANVARLAAAIAKSGQLLVPDEDLERDSRFAADAILAADPMLMDGELDAAARREAARGNRLMWVGEELLETLGSRTHDGAAITAEWGEPDEYGVYEPVFTVHHDDKLGELDAAWRSVEEVLPNKGYAIALRGSANWFGKGPKWIADAYHSDGRRKGWQGDGPTPAAALLALKEQLEARKK